MTDNKRPCNTPSPNLLTIYLPYLTSSHTPLPPLLSHPPSPYLLLHLPPPHLSPLSPQVIPSSQLFYATDIVGSPFATTIVPGAADYPYTNAYGPGLANATAGMIATFFVQTKGTPDPPSLSIP